MRSEYRVVRDKYLGYAVEVRRWWWPIWVEAGGTNTFHTIERAEAFARIHAVQGLPVVSLGRLP